MHDKRRDINQNNKQYNKQLRPNLNIARGGRGNDKLCKIIFHGGIPRASGEDI